MAAKHMELLNLVPEAPDYRIDWTKIEESKVRTLIEKMKEIHQNPLWHGEDDVWTHTKMVCEALVKMEAFLNQDLRRQQELFLACLFHDIGKIPCTRWEDETWTSPNHTSVGARMTREFLWKEYGFCGNSKLQQMRETICTLIRYHSLPPYASERKDPKRKLIQVASNGELLPDFTIELLCILEEADMRGRISDSMEDSLEAVELCRMLAAEAGCLLGPFEFPDECSGYAYLSGKNIVPGQPVYDESWGEVIMLSGLPGTGKDTWIREHYPGYPVISLDKIREEKKIRPDENQGTVIQAAREQAREYLRKKQSFVWNATCISPIIRGRNSSLFYSYGARVKLVFLETEWEEQKRRNQNREKEVLEKVINKMLSNLIPPERFEAESVEWRCI